MYPTISCTIDLLALSFKCLPVDVRGSILLVMLITLYVIVFVLCPTRVLYSKLRFSTIHIKRTTNRYCRVLCFRRTVFDEKLPFSYQIGEHHSNRSSSDNCQYDDGGDEDDGKFHCSKCPKTFNSFYI